MATMLGRSQLKSLRQHINKMRSSRFIHELLCRQAGMLAQPSGSPVKFHVVFPLALMHVLLRRAREGGGSGMIMPESYVVCIQAVI